MPCAAPWGDAHRSDALHNKHDRGVTVPSRTRTRRAHCQPRRPSRFCEELFARRARCRADRSPARTAIRRLVAYSIVTSGGEPVACPSQRACARQGRASGTPLPDSKAEQPPVIRRAELVAFALVALLVICVVAVLYAAKAFFLPIVSAFVVGTMLSPAAGFLERHRIPRAVSAVLIVAAVGAGVAFMVGLISSPLVEWSTRLPELGSQLKEKLHVFDRPLALWHELQTMVGVSDAGSGAGVPVAQIRLGRARRSDFCRRPSPSSCCSSRP